MTLRGLKSSRLYACPSLSNGSGDSTLFLSGSATILNGNDKAWVGRWYYIFVTDIDFAHMLERIHLQEVAGGKSQILGFVNILFTRWLRWIMMEKRGYELIFTLLDEFSVWKNPLPSPPPPPILLLCHFLQRHSSATSFYSSRCLGGVPLKMYRFVGLYEGFMRMARVMLRHHYPFEHIRESVCIFVERLLGGYSNIFQGRTSCSRDSRGWLVGSLQLHQMY